MSGPFVMPMAHQEKETLEVDFAEWMNAGDVLTSVSVTWHDENGNDASSLQDGSPSVSNTSGFVTKGQNRGTKGATYFVIFVGTTSTGRVMGGDELSTIQLEITNNL